MHASSRCLLAFILSGAMAFLATAGAPAPANDKAPAKPVPLVKAETIKINSFDFAEAELADCLSYLQKQSVEGDPEKDANKNGLGFMSNPGSAPLPLVTLSLRDVSIWEICRHLAKITGLAVSVSNFKIYFHPKGQRPGPREGETFYEPPPPSPDKLVVLVKAESIKVKSFDFKEADFNICLSYLRKKSAEEDPEKDANKRGIGFINDAGPTLVPPVTLSLKNTSIWEICRRLAKITGLELSVSHFKIYFHPKGERPVPRQGETFYDPPPKPAEKGKGSSSSPDGGNKE